jgi:hypothetical protein
MVSGVLQLALPLRGSLMSPTGRLSRYSTDRLLESQLAAYADAFRYHFIVMSAGTCISSLPIDSGSVTIGRRMIQGAGALERNTAMGATASPSGCVERPLPGPIGGLAADLGRQLPLAMLVNECLLVHVTHSTADVPVSASTCHSVAWPEYSRRVDKSHWPKSAPQRQTGRRCLA